MFFDSDATLDTEAKWDIDTGTALDDEVDPHTGVDTGDKYPEDTSCTDGVDCYCDRAADSADPLYDPDLLFCEDFEDDLLNWSRPSSGGDNGASGWFEQFGPLPSGCHVGGDFRDLEGSGEEKCVNVVQQGACDSPDPDCVHEGQNSAGFKFVPGKGGAYTGSARWSESSRRVGYTYVFKYSSNFFDDGLPTRTNSFSDGSGNGKHCLLGCDSKSMSKYSPSFEPDPLPEFSGSTPEHLSIHMDPEACDGGSCFGNRNQGVAQGWTNNRYTLAPEAFSGPAPGEWACASFHIDGWGESSATIRAWHGDVRVLHLTDVDLTGVKGGAEPLGLLEFSNYRSRVYEGAELAYIYQDNIHITSGSEPISCAALGFSGGAE
jgi:hypothetical protein